MSRARLLDPSRWVTNERRSLSDRSTAIDRHGDFVFPRRPASHRVYSIIVCRYLRRFVFIFSVRVGFLDAEASLGSRFVRLATTLAGIRGPTNIPGCMRDERKNGFVNFRTRTSRRVCPPHTRVDASVSVRVRYGMGARGCVYGDERASRAVLCTRRQAEKSSLSGLPGIVRKRLPGFSVAPLPWLVPPANAGAELDSSTKNEHETHTRIVVYLQRKEPKR